MHDIVTESMPKIELLFEQKRLVTGVPTGFSDLDRMTRGFQAGDLIIIAARPSMGKTSLVMNIAEHASLKEGTTVGFFSLEMSREQLFIRLLTSVARIDAHRLMSGAIGPREYQGLSQAIGVLGEARLFIDDTPGVGVLEMRAKARRLAAEHGLGLLIIDYLQLMTGRGRFENRTLELAAISRGLKGLAKELGVPVVALSQLSRAPEARSDHRPLLSDLRESGALEQDADVVLMLFRADMYPDAKPEDQGKAELIIAKQRNGPTGSIELAFLKQHTRFEDLAGGYRAERGELIRRRAPFHRRSHRPRRDRGQLPRDHSLSGGRVAGRLAAVGDCRRQGERVRPRRRAGGARARAGRRGDAGVRRHRGGGRAPDGGGARRHPRVRRDERQRSRRAVRARPGADHLDADGRPRRRSGGRSPRRRESAIT